MAISQDHLFKSLRNPYKFVKNESINIFWSTSHIYLKLTSELYNIKLFRLTSLLWRHHTMTSFYDVINKVSIFLVFLLTLARHCDFLKKFHTKPVIYIKQLCFGFQKMQTELKNDFPLDFYCKLKICVFSKNTRFLKNFWWRQQKMAAIMENFFLPFCWY